MTVEKLNEIKELIKDKELENAKMLGILEETKNACKEKYNTDDIDELNAILKDKELELSENKEKLKELWSKLIVELKEVGINYEFD